MLRTVLTLLLMLTLTNCGVEAGNPGDKPKSGSLNIHIARQPVTGSESLSLDLASLDIVDEDGQTVIASLTPAISSVDLFGLVGGDDELVASSEGVPVGTYKQLVIRLNGDKPVRYRSPKGEDEAVELEDNEYRSFLIEQSFEIAEGSITSLVVNLDPYKSLVRGDKLVFKPRGDARPRGRGVEHQGVAPDATAQWVCAYAYDLKFPPPGKDNPVGLVLHGNMPAPGPPRIEDRTFYMNRGEIVFDETASCTNAFAKAPVLSGAYGLRHLLPGSYALRFFLPDGSFVDAGEDVTLAPPPPPTDGQLHSRFADVQ